MFLNLRISDTVWVKLMDMAALYFPLYLHLIVFPLLLFWGKKNGLISSESHPRFQPSL